jgi:alpha-beta hydrolase superfamily lysophospholipase
MRPTRYLPRLVSTLAFSALLLTACGLPAVSAPTPTAAPRPTATPTPAPGTFYITTEDGVTLSVKPFGQGTTAVVLSAEDDTQGLVWDSLAQQLAAHGYLALTYDYRGVGASQGFYVAGKVDQDLRAVITAARARGATRIVLVGASLGGLVTAKVALTEHPVAMAVLSAPISFAGFSLSTEDLRATTWPKLVVASQDDGQFAHNAQQIYDGMPQPKELKIYPGISHGTNIVDNPATQPDFMARFFAFMASYAPANG